MSQQRGARWFHDTIDAVRPLPDGSRQIGFRDATGWVNVYQPAGVLLIQQGDRCSLLVDMPDGSLWGREIEHLVIGEKTVW
jgi:hypothetical protein